MECEKKSCKKNISNFIFGFVGLGLMGGSLARAVRKNVLSEKNATGKIFALDAKDETLQNAKRDGIIDEGFSILQAKKMLSQCDFVFICLYPRDCLKFLKENKDFFKDGAILTEISGIKNQIFKSKNEFEKDSIDFISGHPMAGSEKEGYEMSSAVNFQNHTYIIISDKKNQKENIALFKNLVKKMGFSQIVETNYLDHDKKIAFTSQLCHVIAAAMTDCAENEKICNFAGGSFEDMTRIAQINAQLWAELFILNKDALVEKISEFEKSLLRLKNFLENENQTGIENYLLEVRKKRILMENAQ